MIYIDTYIYFHVYNMKCCLYICHKIRINFRDYSRLTAVAAMLRKAKKKKKAKKMRRKKIYANGKPYVIEVIVKFSESVTKYRI